MSYSKSKNREAKCHTRLYNAFLPHQPTLESFGFHICDKISESTTTSAHSSQTPICYPFVKWAGGKRQIVSQLYALAPLKFDRYIEPFLGGGALFFYLVSNKNKRFTAYLSDINSELINSYIVVKDKVEKLIILLTQHEIAYKKAPEEYCYWLRDNYSPTDNIERVSLIGHAEMEKEIQRTNEYYPRPGHSGSR